LTLPLRSFDGHLIFSRPDGHKVDLVAMKHPYAGINEVQHMIEPGWHWALTPGEQPRTERSPLIRAIDYEKIARVETALFHDELVSRMGKALTINISSGGMLVLMEDEPGVREVFKIYVPTPINQAKTPTLAEVVWTRPVPFAPEELHFVGVRFLI
jgi:hypothetical protein